MHASPATMPRTATPSFVVSAMAPMVERFARRISIDAELDRLVLPSVPDTVIAVRKVLQNPDADSEAVCRTMSRDPSLAAQVLRVANSPAFAGLSMCNNLQSAIVRLGNAVVDNVLLVLTISRVFSVGGRARIQPHLARMWAHSARVAGLSDLLAERTPHLQRDVAVLAGLIHDIGSVPLIVKAQEFPTLLDNPVLLGHLLEKLHCELGKLVLETWNGPEELLQVVLEHHNINRDHPGPADYADLVLVANLLSHLDAPDSQTAIPICELPACHKIGVEAHTVPELLACAAERQTELNLSAGGA